MPERYAVTLAAVEDNTRTELAEDCLEGFALPNRSVDPRVAMHTFDTDTVFRKKNFTHMSNAFPGKTQKRVGAHWVWENVPNTCQTRA
jgi:hypothetical protein